MVRLIKENYEDEALEEFMDIFQGQFWTGKEDLAKDLHDNGYEIAEINDEYMVIDKDDSSFQVGLIIARNTIAIDINNIKILREDIDEEFEFSISKYAKFLKKDVNEFLQEEYSEDDILKLDAYIDAQLSDNSMTLSDINDWDIAWLKRIMSEAMNMKQENAMTYRIPKNVVEEIITSEKFIKKLKEEYGGSCGVASHDCAQAVNMTSKTCLARPVPVSTVYVDDEDDNKEVKVSPKENILVDIDNCIFDFTNKKFRKKKKPYTEVEGMQVNAYDNSRIEEDTLPKVTDNYINLYNFIREAYIAKLSPKKESLITVMEDLELVDRGITGDWGIEVIINGKTYFYVSNGELSIDEIYRRFEKASKYSQGKALSNVLKKYCRLATDEDMEIINLRNEITNPNLDEEDFYNAMDRLKELGAE